MDLKETDHGVDQNNHWYYCSKNIPLVRFAGKILSSSSPMTIIDIGAGTGYFSQVLDKKFGNKIAKIILVDINYTEEEVEQSRAERIQKVRFFPEQITHSIIIMMDILEHIERDDVFLNDLISKAKGINYFFITVRAFKSLWSYHDEYLLHFRRYTLKTLSELINKSGIKINARYYLYFVLFPLAWFVRKILNRNKKDGNDMSQPSGIVNLFLKYFFSFEMYFAKLNKICGTSCCIEGVLKN
jgi:23S rRNA U2552 (ribose-2'-O)-methylase RlmE/FtsJ